MSNLMWPVHDQVLEGSWEIAREILSRVDSIHQRLNRSLQYSNDREERASIREKRRTLRTYAILCERTWELYEWARSDEAKAARPEHPWDTEPAAQSKYAEALGLTKDEQPISPMRGVIELHQKLQEAFETGAELFY